MPRQLTASGKMGVKIMTKLSRSWQAEWNSQIPRSRRQSYSRKVDQAGNTVCDKPKREENHQHPFAATRIKQLFLVSMQSKFIEKTTLVILYFCLYITVEVSAFFTLWRLCLYIFPKLQVVVFYILWYNWKQDIGHQERSLGHEIKRRDVYH